MTENPLVRFVLVVLVGIGSYYGYSEYGAPGPAGPEQPTMQTPVERRPETPSRPRQSVRNRFLQESRPNRFLQEPLTLDEAIDTHWDDIQAYVTGIDEIDACDLINSGCYTLTADIIGGHVDTIHFSNGDSLSFFTPIDASGSALEVDIDGRLWEFTVDMRGCPVRC